MKNSEFIIRPYRIDDEADVIALWFTCDLVVPWNNPKCDIERKLKVDPELFLVGLVKGKLIATVMGGYEGHRGWINYLAVSPQFRNAGYGRQMMAVIEKKLKAIGCPKINLQVRETNIEVIRFYEAIGYTNDHVISLGKHLQHDPDYQRMTSGVK